MLNRSLRLLVVEAATSIAVDPNQPKVGIHEFVDPHFLNNRRPLVPGGAWTEEMLARKSLADLQQIWFTVLKERNMVLTMKDHYLRHMEELGALPAPSRLKMLDQTLQNIRTVVKHRDWRATDQAQEVFRRRLAEGVYRYPPGPPRAPGHGDPTSTIRVTLSQYTSEERLRELFGQYDRFEAHRGIVRIDMSLPEEVLKKKEAAETAFEEWKLALSDYSSYEALRRRDENGKSAPSIFDLDVAVELAPGVFLDNDAQPVVGHDLEVPPPQKVKPLPADPLERIREEARPLTARRNIQLGYFPNVTMEPPLHPGPRPTHPDEILGPWEARIIYDSKKGAEYAMNLGIRAIDGADVLSVEDVTVASPVAERDPTYQEVMREDEADLKTQMGWPQRPRWKREYNELAQRPLHEIVTYNYSNVVDYVERESLLSGQSIWELPIEIDPSCGRSIHIPPGVEPPTHTLPKYPNLFDTY